MGGAMSSDNRKRAEVLDRERQAQEEALERLTSPQPSTTKSKVTSAMASFAGALTKDKADNNPVMGGGPTLDALVLGALEPVLKNWLDENLEPLVERLVKEELKRMARRAEDDI